MDDKLSTYFDEYRKNANTIRKLEKERDRLSNTLEKTMAGELFFSLNEKQKELFRGVYFASSFNKYFSVLDDIKKYQEKLDKIESKILAHEEFPFKDRGLTIYITDGVDTYNALSDESTKDIDIADADKIVIKEIVSNNYGFESEFEVSDISLIKVIYGKINKNGEDYPYRLANWIIEDNIFNQVKRIHKLDKSHSTYKENRRPFIENLKESIASTELEIKNSDSGFKYLLLYSIEAAKYEVSLLEGKRVTTILKEIDGSNLSESEKDYKKDALVEAYYNLTNIDFRKQSEYFDNDNDICYAAFETANPEINKRLIKMRQG